MSNLTATSTANVGNANAFQASQISTLNMLPSNTNINFRADDMKFGVYEQTQLDNTAAFSTLETISPTEVGTNTGNLYQIVLQFTNVNWVNIHEMYLELPVTIQCTTPIQMKIPIQGEQGVETNIYYDPILFNNPIAMLMFQQFFQPGSAGYNDQPNLFTCAPFELGYYPNDAVLQLFEKVQVFGGTNNQPLTNTTMFSQPYLNIVPQLDKIDDNLATIYGTSGVPISSCGSRIQVIKNGGSISTPNLQLPYARPLAMYSTGGPPLLAINDHQMRAFESTVRMASQEFGAKMTVGTTTVSYTNAFTISIPMSKLSEWFKANKYIPPEFRYKITIQIRSTPVPIYTALTTTTPNGGLIPITYNLSYDSSRDIIMKVRTEVLQPPLQQQLNEKWNKNLFTYNLETFEPIIIPTVNFPYSTVIQTSQQRPLSLVIAVQAINNVPFKNPTNVNTDVPFTCVANQLVPWLDDKLAPLMITEISIYISGKTVILFENLDVNQQDVIPTGFENIDNMKLKECNQRYTNWMGVNQNQIMSNFLSTYIAKPIIIPLPPTMIYDSNYYPTDQGAVQIKLTIKTNGKLNSNFQLIVYKQYTQQVSVDTNLKATITQWPARVVQLPSQSSQLQQPGVVQGN